MVVHPPSTSQRQMTEAELAAAGITPGLLRVSVGLEDLEDLARRLRATRLAAARDARPERPVPAARRRLGARAIATPAAVRGPRRPSGRELRRPAGLGAVAAVHLGRLRGRPDHLPGAAGGRRDDAQAAARLRVPLGRRLRDGDGPAARPLRPGPRAARRGRHGAAGAVRGLPLAVVQRRRWSSSSSRSSSARSTGRPGCGAASATSASSSPSRSSTRSCPTARRWTAWPADDVRAVLRRNGFRVREATDADGTRYVYGDRHQYTKMATLFTHLGLILFLRRRRRDLAARRRAGPRRRRGRVADRPADRHARASCWSRTSTSRRPASTPASRPTSRPTSPSTRTASRSRARRSGSTTRCRSRATRSTRTASGRRRTSSSQTRAGAAAVGRPGPDDRRRRRPAVRLDRRPRPGHRAQAAARQGRRRHGRPRRHARTGSSGPTPTASRSTDLHRRSTCTRGDARSSQDLDLSIGLTDFGEFTLLIAKRDPGQGLVWIAFACLIAGITITFYRPRRRVWTRLAPDGRLGIVWRSDRYVDVEREFGRLLDQLVAARRPPSATR